MTRQAFEEFVKTFCAERVVVLEVDGGVEVYGDTGESQKDVPDGVSFCGYDSIEFYGFFDLDDNSVRLHINSHVAFRSGAEDIERRMIELSGLVD